MSAWVRPRIPCREEGCTALAYRRGLCGRHLRRLGLMDERPLLGPPSPTFQQRFWSRVDQSGECWEWTATRNRGGYGWTWFEGRASSAHRVAWTLTIGRIPAGLWVLHHCDNPPCVRPDHLFLGTDIDNITDMHRKGRARTGSVPGERNPKAKLTEADVRDIRRRSGTGERIVSIARDYPVRYETVRRVISGEQWKQVS